VAREQALVVEAVLDAPRGEQVRDEDLRAIDHAQQRVAGLGAREVEPDRALALVVHVEGRTLGEVRLVARELRAAVAVDLAARQLDLHDVGAQVGQQRSGGGHGDEARHLDDANTSERCVHGETSAPRITRRRPPERDARGGPDYCWVTILTPIAVKLTTA
jgi:hypothetical protein